MSSKTKKSSKKAVAKKTTKPSEKVVEITMQALKHDCPKCNSKRGHRCIYTTSQNGHKKGQKRNRPHRVRLSKAVKQSKHTSKKAA